MDESNEMVRPKTHRGYTDRCLLADKEKYLSRQQKKREVNRNCNRRRAENGKARQCHRRYKYGLSESQFTELRVLQNDRCPICKTPFSLLLDRPGERTKIHVDHCHRTGKIRGLICDKCNLLLGCANESATLLRMAQRYLECGGILGELYVPDLGRANKLDRYRRTYAEKKATASKLRG
jgi:hypothetical protein